MEESIGGVGGLYFHKWAQLATLYFFFFVSWNQATEYNLPVKQEDCLYLVWIAVCSLALTASRPPNFTPQRCSRRSRRMQGVGSVAVGVEVLEREGAIISMWS